MNVGSRTEPASLAPSALSRPPWSGASVYPRRSAASTAQIASIIHHSFMSGVYDPTCTLTPWKHRPDVLRASIWTDDRQERRRQLDVLVLSWEAAVCLTFKSVSIYVWVAHGGKCIIRNSRDGGGDDKTSVAFCTILRSSQPGLILSCSRSPLEDQGYIENQWILGASPLSISQGEHPVRLSATGARLTQQTQRDTKSEDTCTQKLVENNLQSTNIRVFGEVRPGNADEHEVFK